MDDKHLLLTVKPWGIDLVRHPTLEMVVELKEGKGGREYVSEEYRSGESWDAYKLAGGNFKVEQDMPVHIHKDNTTYLKDYSFAEMDRPFGHRHRTWTNEPISIDDPRLASGKYTGENASDMFQKVKFSKNVLSFIYTGKTASKDASGNWQSKFYFAYDLYLVKNGSEGYPVDKEFLWIGPVIRNHGGPP